MGTWACCPPDSNEYSKYLESPSELVERPGLSDLAYILSWREMEMEDEEHGYEDPSGWMNSLPSSPWVKIPSGLPLPYLFADFSASHPTSCMPHAKRSDIKTQVTPYSWMFCVLGLDTRALCILRKHCRPLSHTLDSTHWIL